MKKAVVIALPSQESVCKVVCNGMRYECLTDTLQHDLNGARYCVSLPRYNRTFAEGLLVSYLDQQCRVAQIDRYEVMKEWQARPIMKRKPCLMHISAKSMLKSLTTVVTS